MKYTAIEVGGVAKIVPVAGCTTCPHKRDEGEGATKFMRCTHAGKKKKLIGNWTGAYHESCGLPIQAENFSRGES